MSPYVFPPERFSLFFRLSESGLLLSPWYTVMVMTNGKVMMLMRGGGEGRDDGDGDSEDFGGSDDGVGYFGDVCFGVVVLTR